jgi:hypothetical protein
MESSSSKKPPRVPARNANILSSDDDPYNDNSENVLKQRHSL